MKSIKFSHWYNKHDGVLIEGVENRAKLLQVLPVHKKNLSEEFIDFDTKYRGGKYKLQNRDYVLLIFQSLQTRHLFPTIRSKIGMYGRDKEEYYKKLVGQVFKVEVRKCMKI